MALVKYSGPIEELAGSVAGLTFQRTKAGHIARLRVRPIDNKTPARAEATALLSTYSAAWYDVLTEPQRVAWDTAAALATWVNTLGQNYSPTGMAAYIRSAICAKTAGQTPRVQAPTAIDEALSGFEMAYVPGAACRITNFGTLASPPDGRLVIHRSDPQTPGRHTFNGPWIFRTSALISTLPAAPWTVYNLDFPHPDLIIHFRLRVFRTVDAGVPPPYYFGRCSHVTDLELFAAEWP